MNGEVIISHQTGWACSNSAEIDIEKDIERDPISGKPVVSRQTNVLLAEGLFQVTGELKKDAEVQCVLKLETGQKVAFNGRVRGIIDRKIQIVIKGELNNNVEQIINSVKQWQDQ